MTKAEALLEYVSSAGRVCPKTPAWNSLWHLLRDRAPTERHRTLSPPLILAAWWETSDQEKRARLRHQIEWAEQHHLIDVVDQRLRGLSENQWHHQYAKAGPGSLPMTQDEALEFARSHVLSQIQLVPCVKIPETLYGFDSEKSYLFTLDWLGGSDHIGGSVYLAVSRQTGDVTMFGRHGE